MRRFALIFTTSCIDKNPNNCYTTYGYVLHLCSDLTFIGCRRWALCSRLFSYPDYFKKARYVRISPAFWRKLRCSFEALFPQAYPLFKVEGRSWIVKQEIRFIPYKLRFPALLPVRPFKPQKPFLYRAAYIRLKSRHRAAPSCKRFCCNYTKFLVRFLYNICNCVPHSIIAKRARHFHRGIVDRF